MRQGHSLLGLMQIRPRLAEWLQLMADLEFVKKFTRPNFWAKEFYTLRTRK